MFHLFCFLFLIFDVIPILHLDFVLPHARDQSTFCFDLTRLVLQEFSFLKLVSKMIVSSCHVMKLSCVLAFFHPFS